MISVKHLTKCYGEFTAVDDLSFEIDEGHVYFINSEACHDWSIPDCLSGCWYCDCCEEETGK